MEKKLSGKNHQTNEERKHAQKTGLFRCFSAVSLRSLDVV